MRVLPLCLLALLLTGCSLLHKPYKPVEPFKTTPQPEQPTRVKPAPHPAVVKIYTDANDLVSRPFRDLGEVYGEECQSGTHSSPASLNIARKRMQSRASALKANAILLHRCEIVSNVKGCYRQAICQGSALKVSNQ